METPKKPLKMEMDLSHLPKTIGETLAVDPTGKRPDEFVSRTIPYRMGNELPVAYGGCALAIGLQAAARTVPSSHKLYSIMGHWLSGASPSHHFICRVYRSRDTRVFASRRVQIIQPFKRKSDGKEEERVVMEQLADFMVEEPALMEYSARPHRIALGKTKTNADGQRFPYYTPPDQCQTRAQHIETAGRQNKIADMDHLRQFTSLFVIESHWFDIRLVPESLSVQNINGVLPCEPTDQDDEHITDRTSAEWYRVQPLPPGSTPTVEHGGTSSGSGNNDDEATQWATVAWMLDSGLPIGALVHDHKVFTDAVNASLDFSLRFVRPSGLKLRDQWYLRERVTIGGAVGRSHGEFRLWDEEGNLVATMTQQGLMRKPAPPKQSTEDGGKKAAGKSVL